MPKADTRLNPGIDSLYAAMSGRKMFHQSDMEDYDKARQVKPTLPRPIPYDAKDDTHMAQANLVSSELENLNHLPVIDCDFPIQAVPSSTAGHYHLYIDKELTWVQYKALLDGMLAAGLIQENWYKNAISHKRTYVRMPHVRKSA
jgi:hypothetical protein